MTQPLIRVLQIESDELNLRIRTVVSQTSVGIHSDVVIGSPGATLPSVNDALIWNGSAFVPQPVGGAGAGGSTIFQTPGLPFAPGHLVVYDNIPGPGGSPPGGSPGGFYNVDVIRLGNSSQFIVASESALDFGSPRFPGSPQPGSPQTGSPANLSSLEIRANIPGLLFHDDDAVVNEKAWRFIVDEGDFIGELRSDSGVTSQRWLEITRNGVRVDELALYIGQQERAIRALRGAAVELYHDNALIAETTTASAGGLVVNNQFTGTGFERVLTVSDQGVIINTNVGDGLELVVGSPQTIQVDASVVRFAGSPIVTGSPSRGDILYDDGSGKFVRLPIGTTGQVLTAGSPTLAWKDATGGSGGLTGSPFLDIRGGDGIDVTFGSPRVTIAVDSTVARLRYGSPVPFGGSPTRGQTFIGNQTFTNNVTFTGGATFTDGSPATTNALKLTSPTYGWNIFSNEGLGLLSIRGNDPWNNEYGVEFDSGGIVYLGGGGAVFLGSPELPRLGDQFNNSIEFSTGDASTSIAAEVGFYGDDFFQFGSLVQDGPFGFYVTKDTPTGYVYPFLVNTDEGKTYFPQFDVRFGADGGTWAPITYSTTYAEFGHDGTDFNIRTANTRNITFLGSPVSGGSPTADALVVIPGSPQAQGMLVRNLVTGTGLERVLTISDLVGTGGSPVDPANIVGGDGITVAVGSPEYLIAVDGTVIRTTSSINALADVDTAGALENQVLTYSGSPLAWRAVTGGGGGSGGDSVFAGDGINIVAGSPLSNKTISVDSSVVRFGSPQGGSPLIGTILYSDASGRFLRLARGIAGQVLTMGSPLLPSWQNITGGSPLQFFASDGLEFGAGSPKGLQVDSTVARQANNETITGNWTFVGGSPIESQCGTGAKVQDGTGVARPVGFNVAPIYEINASESFDLEHNGFVYHKFGSPDLPVTFTCSESGSPTTLPQGASWVVHNDSLSDITIAAGAGVTINFLASGGAPVAGDVTIQAGGIVTVYKYTDTEYWVWGDSTALSLSLNDLSDVTAGSPTIGAVLYNDGTNWLKLARGTAGQVLTMGSPLLPTWKAQQALGNGSPVQDIRGGDGINITFGSPVATISVDATVLRITSNLDDLANVTGSPNVAGDILYYNGTNWINLPRGTAGQVLTMGSPLLPTWKASAAGSVGSPLLDIRGGDGITVTFGSPKATIAVDNTVARLSTGSPVTFNTGTLALRVGSPIRWPALVIDGDPGDPTTPIIQVNNFNPGTTAARRVFEFLENGTAGWYFEMGEGASGDNIFQLGSNYSGAIDPLLEILADGRLQFANDVFLFDGTAGTRTLTIDASTATASSAAIIVQSDVDAYLHLRADVDNTGGEGHNPYVRFSQDGDLVDAWIGTSTADFDAGGNTFTNMPENGLAIHSDYSPGTGIGIGVNNTAYWTMDNTGNIIQRASFRVGSPTYALIPGSPVTTGMKVRNLVTGAGLERVLTTSDLTGAANIVGGDGITVTTGSPQYSVAVDNTVARLTGSPPTGSPSQIFQGPNTFLNTTTFEINPQTVDGTGVRQPVGLGVLPPYNINTSALLDTAHAGMVWHVDAGSPAVTFTAPNDPTIRVGSLWQIQNDDVENVTIAAGSPSVTILRLGAGGAPVSGNVLLQQGGIVTVYKYRGSPVSATEYWVYGDSEAVGFGSPCPYPLNALTDVNAGSPTIGAVLYSDGTNWLKLPRGAASQVLTMGSPLLPSWKTLSVADLSGSPAVATNVVGGDGITVVTGSPEVTVSVDATVFRTTNVLNDIADVSAGSPTIGAVLYNDGTNWLKLPRGTAGQVLTMGSPLLPSWQANAALGSPVSVVVEAGSPVDSTLRWNGSRWVSESQVRITAAGALEIRDSAELDTVSIRHDGSNLLIEETQGTTGQISIRDGMDLYIYEEANTDHVRVYHDGSWGWYEVSGAGSQYMIFNLDTSAGIGILFQDEGSTRFDIDVSNSQIKVRDGYEFRIQDTGDTDYAAFSHDGADFLTSFNQTSDWAITGPTDQITLDGVAGLDTTTTAVGGSPISTTTIASHPAATYRSVEYRIQATRGNNYHTTNVLAIHGGSPDTASYSEYGSLQVPSFFGSPNVGSPNTSGTSATYAVDISGGNMRLRATSRGGAGTITFKVISTLTTV